MEKEKKEGLQKIQAMNQEIRDLKTKLNDFEANKAKDIKKLEDSLTDSLKSNKKAQETLDHEKVVISEVEGSKKKLLDEISTLKKDKQKVETEMKNLQSVLDKKKQAEKELENMIKVVPDNFTPTKDR